jgi:hypothetical protein
MDQRERMRLWLKERDRQYEIVCAVGFLLRSVVFLLLFMAAMTYAFWSASL